MSSRSEGWGGLFKDEQYRLITIASRASIRSRYAELLTDHPVCAFGADNPSLLRRGILQNQI
jgi:hypothetical protein